MIKGKGSVGTKLEANVDWQLRIVRLENLVYSWWRYTHQIFSTKRYQRPELITLFMFVYSTLTLIASFACSERPFALIARRCTHEHSVKWL